VVDVRVGDENRVDTTCGSRAPGQQRIEDHASFPQLGNRGGMAQPGNAWTSRRLRIFL
jgi:hypothetical protein